MTQNPSFISGRQFYGPPYGAKNAPIADKTPVKTIKGLAKVQPVKSNSLQGSDTGNISQGAFKGSKLTTRMNSLIGK